MAEDKKVKLHARIVFDWVYGADPEHYGTDDPKEMAEIDVGGAEDDLWGFLEDCPHGPEITIEPA